MARTEQESKRREVADLLVLKRSGRLVGAAETGKKHAEWHRFQ